VVVMTMVAMVMRSCGKGRAGKRHNQEHSSDELFHGLNVARQELWKRTGAPQESSEETI